MANDDKSEFNPDTIEVVAEIETPDLGAVDSIADSIIDEAPAVSESIVESIESGETEPGDMSQPKPAPGLGAQSGGAVDKNGESFDPAKHQVNPDGSPKIGATGKLMLKRGRKAGSTAKPSQSKVFTPGTQADPVTGLTPAQMQQAAITGKVSAHLLINASMMIGGTDFAPRAENGIDEKAVLESGFTDYYIATGKTDLPPGVALTTVVAMYMLPRFTMPTTQTRVKSIGAKVYGWWQDRKLKKAKQKEAKANGAQSDTRNDGKRENDVSEKTEPTL